MNVAAREEENRQQKRSNTWKYWLNRRTPIWDWKQNEICLFFVLGREALLQLNSSRRCGKLEKCSIAWLLNNIAKSRLLNFAAATDADDADDNDDRWRWRQHRCRYHYCCRVLLLLLMLPFSSLRHILYAVASLYLFAMKLEF